MSTIDDYDSYDALGLAALVAKGDVSPAELLDSALQRAAEVNPRLNALVHVVPETARRLIRDGLPRGLLHGVPFLLKDLGAEAEDFPASNGSRLFADTRYRYDSTLYARLRASGLVCFGRTTAPEGGVGPVTEAAVYGAPTRNPWNPEHTPGGSSGGAGAAVAAGIVPAAHGSDGGGSVRIPASCCGLFGLKPTRARLPDGPAAGEGWGGMAIDGFLTRSVRDTAALLDATAGPEPGAPYWAPPLDGTFMAAVSRSPGRLRIAFTRDTLDGEPIHPECAAAVAATVSLLEELGHQVEEARPRLAVMDMMQAWTRIVACGSALSVRQRIQARRRPLQDGELEPVAMGALELARTLGGVDYLQAVNQVHDFGRAMAAFFESYDVLVTATLAEPPCRIGRFAHSSRDFVDYRLGANGVYPYSPFTAAFNASGQPAASLPLHMSEQGLPVGVHIATGFGFDERLMSLSAQLERARPWFLNRAPAAPPAGSGAMRG